MLLFVSATLLPLPDAPSATETMSEATEVMIYHPWLNSPLGRRWSDWIVT